MSTSHTPDRVTRMLSHVVAGAGAALIIKKTFPQAAATAQVIGMLPAAYIHSELDAPVADWLAANTDL